MERTRHAVAYWGMLTALALALSIAERMLLLPIFTLPGMRLGLANLAVLIAVYLFGAIPSLMIVMIKSLVVFLFTGNLAGFMFSLTGGLFACSVMLLLSRSKRLSIFGVSISGAGAHNLGQILIACIFTQSLMPLSYLGMLLAVGLLTGGMMAGLAVPVFKALIAMQKLPPASEQ